MGLSVPGPLFITFSLVFYGTPNCENEWVSLLCLLLGLFSSCWVAVSNFNMIVFISSYCVSFVMFGCYLIEACFLK